MGEPGGRDVMAGLVPAIHVLSQSATDKKTWMVGTSSAKTRFALLSGHDGDVSTPFHHRHHPARRFAGPQKVQRRTPHLRRITLAVRDRDKEIAAARDRDADGGVPQAVGHFEV